MSFESVCSRWGLSPDNVTPWSESWSDSTEAESGGTPAWLAPDTVRELASALGWSDGLRGAAVEAGHQVAACPDLVRLAEHLARFLKPGGPDRPRGLSSWPMMPEDAFPRAALFPLFPLLAGIPALRRYCDARGIPTAVLHETLDDVERWIEVHRERTGCWGLSNVGWLSNHLSANLFRLGRLQLQFGRFGFPFAVFRHSRTGATVLFAEDGAGVDAEGFPAEPASGGVPVALSVAAGRIEGRPVTPRGCVSPRPLVLKGAEWVCELRRGDPVLNIHIPAGEPMDLAACADSLRRGRDFFRRHFPEVRWRAIVCGSWLLDPQLQDCLPPTSNLAQFQRHVQLFPLRAGPTTATVERVLGQERFDPATAPRRTSLQRAVADHLVAGGSWRAGGCVLFPEDLATWRGCAPFPPSHR